MNDFAGNGHTPGTLATPRRNHYFYGKLMDELHFQMEQSYSNQKRWLLNRLSLGAGVLCGLQVTEHEGQVCVQPGVAIDALGREIIVPMSIQLNPWQLTDDWGKPVGEPLSHESEHKVELCLAYQECPADFMPVLVAGCNTQGQCAPGTIIESFRFLVQKVQLDGGPPAPENDICDVLSKESTLARRQALCEVLLGKCVAPPARACVCLAIIDLKAGGSAAIDNCACRPLVVSNAMLLELIFCLAAQIG
jgi:hypothetical protein